MILHVQRSVRKKAGALGQLTTGSHDFAKSFATRSTGNRKAEVGGRVLGLRSCTVGGIASIILNRLGRSQSSSTGGRGGQVGFPSCLALDRRPRLLLHATPANRLSWPTTHLSSAVVRVAFATGTSAKSINRLAGHPPRRIWSLGSEGRNAAVAISQRPRFISIYPPR